MPAPSTRMCHICGRQFGKNSIDIHIPQCLKKYEAAQAQLPPHERKPAPAAPQLLGAGASDRAYNDAAYEALEANMAECEFCGRTFAPDRLAIHNRSCTAANPAKRRPCRAGVASRRSRVEPTRPQRSPRGSHRPGPAATCRRRRRAAAADGAAAARLGAEGWARRARDDAQIDALEARAEKLEGIVVAALEAPGSARTSRRCDSITTPGQHARGARRAAPRARAGASRAGRGAPPAPVRARRRRVRARPARRADHGVQVVVVLVAVGDDATSPTGRLIGK
ncbi:hypothetical protein JL722_10656 [Aureococcus anophagefferens]|nr:hypothetical protein JL722_10656 [Aureococcus anophagefferens]